jgi:hypothetical protein
MTRGSSASRCVAGRRLGSTAGVLWTSVLVGEVHEALPLETAAQFTLFWTLPSRNAATFSTAVAIRRLRASTLAQAM